jgi:ribose transport system substrate-binding protein
VENDVKSFLTMAGVACLLAGSASAQTIGVTLARFDSTWITLLRNGMEARLAELGSEAELQIEDAGNDPSRQLDQVQNFVASGVDAIVVVTVDADATPAMTKAAADAGVPIVYLNHPPGDLDTLPDSAAFVGSNELDCGTMQMREACRLMGGKGEILVLMGPLNNRSALQRTQDIKDVLAMPECAGISIVDEQTANWDRLEAVNLMTNWLSSGIEFQGVIANNDEMAIGAIQSLQGVGANFDELVIAGIDATPDGLQAMEAGELDITVFQDANAQGAAALDAALAFARGEPVEQTIWIPFELVTPANMQEYKAAN